jgi:hypothetical protein
VLMLLLLRCSPVRVCCLQLLPRACIQLHVGQDALVVFKHSLTL